jgi:ubiquitin carboxyl-terminal hydrolase 6/32
LSLSLSFSLAALPFSNFTTKLSLFPVSDGELRRIKEAFRKCTGTNINFLSKSAFVQEVLCEGTPSNLADIIFTSCGGTSKGINFKDLISALVLITRGTQDEKIR